MKKILLLLFCLLSFAAAFILPLISQPDIAEAATTAKFNLWVTAEIESPDGNYKISNNETVRAATVCVVAHKQIDSGITTKSYIFEDSPLILFKQKDNENWQTCSTYFDYIHETGHYNYIAVVNDFKSPLFSFTVLNDIGGDVPGEPDIDQPIIDEPKPIAPTLTPTTKKSGAQTALIVIAVIVVVGLIGFVGFKKFLKRS